MVNQTERPKATPFEVFVAIFCGLLSYAGGFLVTLTRRIGWLALAGVAISVISTSAAYVLRKPTDPVRAKKRLRVDPLLYGFEFVFAVIVIYCVLTRTDDDPDYSLCFRCHFMVRGEPLVAELIRFEASHPRPALTSRWNRGNRGFEQRVGFSLVGLAFG